jgi:hypothetical protein
LNAPDAKTTGGLGGKWAFFLTGNRIDFYCISFGVGVQVTGFEFVDQADAASFLYPLQTDIVR